MERFDLNSTLWGSQQPFQHLYNLIAKLACTRGPAEICCPQTAAASIFIIKNSSHGVLHRLSFPFETEGVPEQHGRTENRSDRVCDAFTRDVRSGTVYGFVETWRRFERRGRRSRGCACQ
jgi:hypothetical protein